jgi:hypothetical protein
MPAGHPHRPLQPPRLPPLLALWAAARPPPHWVSQLPLAPGGHDTLALPRAGWLAGWTALRLHLGPVVACQVSLPCCRLFCLALLACLPTQLRTLGTR